MKQGDNLSQLIDKFTALLKEKKSILCVGLDPALPQQREKDVIPSSYLKQADQNTARLNFCLDIIEQVKEFAIAAKPNEQYILGFTKQQHQELTQAIRAAGMLSILDCKLNDIGETVKSGIFHLAECGYDAVTFNPLAGNLSEAVKLAHDFARSVRGYELGIMVLVLMSNPEATRYMKDAVLDGIPLFLRIADDVKSCGADGCVVGATGHVTEGDIKSIRARAGEDKIFLVPGVGAQKGDPEKVIRAAGENLIINVGRGIIYSPNPKEEAKRYHELFNRARKAVLAKTS